MRKRTDAEIAATSEKVIEALREHGAYLRREISPDPAQARLATAKVYRAGGAGLVMSKIPPSVFYSLLAEGKIVHTERLDASAGLPAVDYYKLGRNA
jgi:hypothetical protein